jgi:hypothetical protein
VFKPSTMNFPHTHTNKKQREEHLFKCEPLSGELDEMEGVGSA